MKILIIFLLISLQTSISFGQIKPSKHTITTIENYAKSIDAKSSTLKKKKINIEDFLKHNPGGSRLTGYYANGKLIKIILWTGLSNGTQTRYYYFKNNELTYVYDENKIFDYDKKTESLNTNKLVDNFKGRYFFQHNKLIDMETTGHNEFEDDTKDPEKILLQQAKEFSKKLNQKQ